MISPSKRTTGGKISSRQSRQAEPQGPKCPTCGLPSDSIVAWDIPEGKKSFPQGQICICLNGEWGGDECWTVMHKDGKKGFLPCPYCEGSLLRVFGPNGPVLICSLRIARHRFEPYLKVGAGGGRSVEITDSHREWPAIALLEQQMIKQGFATHRFAQRIEEGFAEFTRKMEEWRRSWPQS